MKTEKVALAVGAIALLASGSAWAGTFVCNGAYVGVINADVVVKQGMNCTLENVQVNGNIDVKGGRLHFPRSAIVIGNVSVAEDEDVEGVLQLGCERCASAVLTIGAPGHPRSLEVRNALVGSLRKYNVRSSSDTLTVYGNATFEDSFLHGSRIRAVNVSATGSGAHSLTCEADEGLFEIASVSGNPSGDGSCLQ